MYVDDYSISGEQVRAARALLRADQKQIALAVGVSLETIKRLEAVEGPINATSRTLTSLRNAFLKFGVVFDGREDFDLAVGWVRREESSRTIIPRLRRTKMPPAALTRLLFWSRTHNDTGVEIPAQINTEAWLKTRKTADVTGAELEHNGYMVKLLEGPIDVVSSVYDTAMLTRRQNETTLIQSRRVTRRLFESWNILNGESPAVDDIVFNDVGMANGFHPHNMSPAAVVGLFLLLVISQQT